MNHFSHDIIENHRFNTEISTASFVVVSVLTLGFYYYWLLNYVKTLKLLHPATPCSPTMVIIAAGVSAWDMKFSIINNTEVELISYVLCVVAIFLDVLIALQARRALESLLQASGKKIHVKKLWTIIFCGYYHYYLLRKLGSTSLNSMKCIMDI